jgi:hypothetical protein
LQFAANNYILLLDAGLKDVSAMQIRHAIIGILTRRDLDMNILRRVNSSWLVKMIRADLLLSGERILKKEDLRFILQDKIRGYQLEIAINRYMQKNRKKVGWVAHSASNTYKFMKRCFWNGLKHDLKMYLSLITYIGWLNFFEQVFRYDFSELPPARV